MLESRFFVEVTSTSRTKAEKKIGAEDQSYCRETKWATTLQSFRLLRSKPPHRSMTATRWKEVDAFNMLFNWSWCPPARIALNSNQNFENHGALHCISGFEDWFEDFADFLIDFPGGSDSKASVYNVGDLGSIPWSGRSLEKEMATHSSTLG